MIFDTSILKGNIPLIFLILSTVGCIITSIYCLEIGYTIVFQNLFYIPIIFACVFYLRRGFLFSCLLAFIYLILILIYTHDNSILFQACIRVILFICIAGVVTILAEAGKRSEDKLREVNKFQENIITNAKIWLMVLDHKGRILLWNSSAEEISGYPADEVIGKDDIWKMLYPEKEYRSQITETITKIINEKKYLENFETSIRTKDGKERLISWNTRGISDEPGEIPKFIALGMDVTDQYLTEQKLQKSEERFRKLFLENVAGYALHEIICDSSGTPVNYRFLEVNPAFERLTGLKINDILGKTVLEILPKIESYWIETYGQVALIGKSVHFENFSSELNRYFEVTAYSPVHGQFATLILDVTARKMAEIALRESEERLRITLDATNDGIWDWNIPTGSTIFSPRWYSMLGYCSDELPALYTTWESLLHPDDLVLAVKKINEHFAQKDEGYAIEIRMLTKQGNYKWILTRGKVVEWDDKGSPIRMVGTHTDISDRKFIEGELENKHSELLESYEKIAESEEELKHNLYELAQNEKMLRISEERLIMAQDIGLVGSWEYSLESGQIWGSAEGFHIYGFAPVAGDIDLEKIEACIPERDRVHQALVDLISLDREYNLEFTINPVDGSSQKIIHSIARIEKNEHGSPVKVQGVIQDITDLKKNEEVLRETNAYLENLISNANVPILIWDQAFRITRLNHAGEDLIGRSAEETIGHSFDSLFPPDQVEDSIRLLQTTQEGVRWETVRLDIQHRDGSVRNVIWNSATLYSPDGSTPVATIAQGRDITGELQLEKEKDTALVQIQKNLAQLAILNDEIRNPLSVIMAYAEMFSDPQVIDQIHIQVRRIDEIVNHLDIRWIQSEKVLNAIRKHYRLYVSTSESEDSLLEEIETRKKGEDQLKTVLMNLDGFVFSVDKEGIFLLSEGKVLPLICFLSGEVVGQSIFDVFKDIPDIIAGIKIALTGNPWSGIIPVKDTFFDVYILPVLDDQKMVYGAVGFSIDISWQNRTKEALRESEEIYRLTLESTNDGFWDLNIISGKAFFSPRYYTMLGYEPGEFSASFNAWKDLIHPDDRDRIIASLRSQILDKQDFIRTEYRIRANNGEWLWILSRGKPVEYDDQGNVTRLIGTNTDITQLKQAEESLRESELKYRTLTERVHDGIYIYQGDTFVFANERASEITGFSKEEFYTMNLLDLVYPADRTMVQEITQNRPLGKPVPKTFETRIIRKDGSLGYLELAVSEISYNGQYAALGAARDITEKKKVEESLRESEERYRKLIENIPDYILVYRRGEILFVNSAAVTSFGYTMDEMIGSHLMNYLTPESLGVVAEMMQKRFLGEKIPPYEITILTKDGGRITTEVHGVLIQYKGELASLNVLIDITERKQIEDAQTFLLRSDYLQSGGDFFKSLARYLSMTLDMDYVCIDRLDEDLLSAHNMAIFLDGEFKDNVSYTLKDTPFGDVIGTGFCIFSHEVRNIFPKDVLLADMGAESYVGTTLWGFDGKPIGLITVIGRKPLNNAHLAESVLKQVGVRAAGELERNLAEQALKETNEIFSLFMRHSPIYTYIKVVTPTESRILQASDNFEQMIGVLGTDMIGRTMTELFPAEFAAKIIADDWNVVSNGEVLAIEEFLNDRTYLTIKFPIFQRGRSLLAGYTIDITDRKQAERALYEAIQKLHLLTGLTRHDILNQISALKLLLDMMLLTSDLTKVHEYISRSQQACNQVVATIGFTQEYENFGTVSSGWQRVHPIIKFAQKEISLGEISIENLIPEDLEIYADPIIRKVFTTLIENVTRHGGAVKFIRFSCDTIDNTLIIRCEDDGIGIPLGEKTCIFDHGYGKHTGIGLFLASEILSITGLSIRECGEEGKGATFEILVPGGKHRYSHPEII